LVAFATGATRRTFEPPRNVYREHEWNERPPLESPTIRLEGEFLIVSYNPLLWDKGSAWAHLTAHIHAENDSRGYHPWRKAHEYGERWAWQAPLRMVRLNAEDLTRGES
jgi:hypothetical protein